MPVIGCRILFVILQDNGEELFRTQRVGQPGAVSLNFVMNAAIETVQAETDAWNASRNGYPNDYLPSVRPANCFDRPCLGRRRSLPASVRIDQEEICTVCFAGRAEGNLKAVFLIQEIVRSRRRNGREEIEHGRVFRIDPENEILRLPAEHASGCCRGPTVLDFSQDESFGIAVCCEGQGIHDVPGPSELP